MFVEIMTGIGFTTLLFGIYLALDNYSEYRLLNSEWDSKKGKWVYKKRVKN